MQSVIWPSECMILDTSDQPLSADILFPYAWDESMCRQMKADSPALIHIWRHPKAFVLGLRDRQLAYVSQAANWLLGQGYDVAVRNTGGAAVPLDLGVVNISLVMPNPHHTLNFRDDFTRMVRFIRQSLLPWTSAIHVGEIKGSYCPGDYDMSLNGLKFCGIAQRRQAKGFVVQAFVNVEEIGTARTDIARSFYERASSGVEQYPIIDTDRTASLNELIPLSSAHAFIERFKEVVSETFLRVNAITVGSHEEMFSHRQILQTMDDLRLRYAIVKG